MTNPRTLKPLNLSEPLAFRDDTLGRHSLRHLGTYNASRDRRHIFAYKFSQTDEESVISVLEDGLWTGEESRFDVINVVEKRSMYRAVSSEGEFGHFFSDKETAVSCSFNLGHLVGTVRLDYENNDVVGVTFEGLNSGAD